jgi:hypothetical protein
MTRTSLASTWASFDSSLQPGGGTELRKAAENKKPHCHGQATGLLLGKRVDTGPIRPPLIGMFALKAPLDPTSEETSRQFEPMGLVPMGLVPVGADDHLDRSF